MIRIVKYTHKDENSSVSMMRNSDNKSKYFNDMKHIQKFNIKYTGLEHRQTLRACDFNCDLHIEVEN